MMDEFSYERGKRLVEVYHYLKTTGRVKSQRDMAEVIGITETSLSKALKGSPKYTTTALFDKILRAFENIFDEEYLKTGTGSLLKKDNQDTNLGEIHQIEDLKARLQKAESQLSFYEQEIRQKNIQYNQAREDIDNLKKEIERKNQIIEDYRERLLYNAKKETADAG